MATIKPFQGVRYNIAKTEDMSKVVTPPYDVISQKEQEGYYQSHPFNIIRLIKGKDNPEDNEHSNKYTRAACDFTAWHKDGILKKESKPAIYIYEQIFDLKGETFSRKGFIANIKLEELKSGHIFPHEQTLSGPKADRFNLINACSANFSCVFSLYPDSSNKEESVDNIINSNSTGTPDVSFTDDQGVRNSVWVITDSDMVNKIVNMMQDKPLFIADGHHRYETALAYRDKIREELNKKCDNNEHEELSVDYVMMMCVSMANTGLKILPTHRVIKNVNGLSSKEIKDKLSKVFSIEPININGSANHIEETLKKNKELHAFILYLRDEKKFYLITITKEKAHNISYDLEYSNWKFFDVGILHGIILDKLFEIRQIQSKNESKIEYIKNEEDAISLVNDNGYQIAFFLNPTKIKDIQLVAKDRQIMPPKSTYFYPKLCTGIVISKL